MGLLRGVARTAVVAGTATAVSNRVSRRQANRWAGQQEAYAAPPPQQAYAPPPQEAYAAPPPAASEDVIAQLERLGKLRDDGILTDAEFSAQKAKLLAG
ncbi:SHOCT domain-containing protein [Promicromonospora sp. MEB111]|uniref:SHOCT domain-containing protein n=1 Tax=unclassified Promicromonospora TaxID=2647929 RepID=UPI00254D72E3|nr:SHOCT domain-containing protein [Promicromonospora sp. MEB111]